MRSRAHLLLALLLAVGVPLAAFTAAAVWNARSALRSQAEHENESAARLAAQAVESHFSGLLEYVDHGGNSPSLARCVERHDVDGGRAELERFLLHNREFDRVFATDVDGIELFDSPNDASVIGTSFAFRDWYKGVSKSGRPYVSEVYRRAALGGEWIIAVAAPIPSGRGGRAGYLVAQHPIATLTRKLVASRPGRDGAIQLVDHREHLVEDRDGDTLPSITAHPVAARLSSGAVGAFDGVDPETGERNLYSWYDVSSIGWTVLAQQPLEVVLEPAQRLQGWIALLSGICLALVVVLGFAWLNTFRRQHLAVLSLQRQKDLLAGMIVHDLRNPLAVAAMSLEEARVGLAQHTPDVAENVASAYEASQRALELVNVILDVMRMEDGALHLERGKYDLSLLVRQKVEEFRSLARAGAVELEALVPPNPPQIEVDSKLLRRVVDNLIVNAIKHTPRGGRVQVKLEPANDSGRAALSVVDNGEGMPPEMLPRLFQKYGRVEGQKLGASYDTGLGLLFCRMAVELHGGTIRAISKLGEGTTIRIELPQVA